MNSSFITLAESLVKNLTDKINGFEIGLKEVEEEILTFLFTVGQQMLDEVAKNIKEPTQENQIEVKGEKALYRDMQNLRMRSRFGNELVIPRRVYKIEGGGSYSPLDEKIGAVLCKSFTPLMTFLLSSFGASLPYAQSSQLLSQAMGINVSATAVETNTERVGKSIDSRPIKSIPTHKQNEASDLMIVEMDATTSPQIKESPGIKGRESMKLPTEYKMCNCVVIQKHQKENGKYELKDSWIGATYGPKEEYQEYIHQAGIKMGQLKAKTIVFLADGLPVNWDIRMSCFPDAIEILDIYHVLEHLRDFTKLLKNGNSGTQLFHIWRKMIFDGDILQVIEEMKEKLTVLTDRDQGVKEINYFEKNKDRMAYDEYKEKGYPIGSGIIEGACKYVVGKRFKGSGMRWKKKDNRAVLAVRIELLNGQLEEKFYAKSSQFEYRKTA